MDKRNSDMKKVYLDGKSIKSVKKFYYLDEITRPQVIAGANVIARKSGMNGVSSENMCHY